MWSTGVSGFTRYAYCYLIIISHTYRAHLNLFKLAVLKRQAKFICHIQYRTFFFFNIRGIEHEEEKLLRKMSNMLKMHCKIDINKLIPHPNPLAIHVAHLNLLPREFITNLIKCKCRYKREKKYSTLVLFYQINILPVGLLSLNLILFTYHFEFMKMSCFIKKLRRKGTKRTHYPS